MGLVEVMATNACGACDVARRAKHAWVEDHQAMAERYSKTCLPTFRRGHREDAGDASPHQT